MAELNSEPKSSEFIGYWTGDPYILTDCVLARVGRSGGVSRAERLASSALRNFLGSRVSASAVADLVRVESTSTRASLSFPLFPSRTENSAVFLF